MSSQKKKTSVIVTAGLSKSGKSTALNNIFDCNFKGKCSASSGTKAVDVRCVHINDNELLLLDTVGLAARDIDPDQVRKELLKAIGGLNIILLYCFSVAPSNSHNKADEYVVKNLTETLGKDIWKKCVVLFTNSDVARMFEYSECYQREEYMKYIDEHAKRFTQLLHENCDSNMQVKSIFEVDINTKKDDEIVAIPMGKKLQELHEVHNLTPGMEINWKALARLMILQKAESMDREVYLAFMDTYCLKTMLHMGAVAGGILLSLGLGYLAGTRGAAVGLGAGAAIAAVVRGTTGIENEREGMESKIELLRQAGQKNLKNPDLLEEPDLVQSVHQVKIEGNFEEPDSTVNAEEPDLSSLEVTSLHT